MAETKKIVDILGILTQENGSDKWWCYFKLIYYIWQAC